MVDCDDGSVHDRPACHTQSRWPAVSAHDAVGGRVRSEIGPWAMVPAWVLTVGLTGAQLATYVALRSFADRGGDGWCTSAVIAQRAGVSAGTVRNATGRLRELGLLTTSVRTRPDGSTAGIDFHMRDTPPERGEPDSEFSTPPTAGDPPCHQPVTGVSSADDRGCHQPVTPKNTPMNTPTNKGGRAPHEPPS